jgi:hypothetical protein
MKANETAAQLVTEFRDIGIFDFKTKEAMKYYPFISFLSDVELCKVK